MKAAVFAADGVPHVVSRDRQEPGPGEVRVAVTAVGICGSDLHISHGMFGSPEGLQPGHEIAGVIDRVGDGVTLETGIVVSVEPVVACGSCHYCRVGRPNLCTTMILLGVTRPGALAESINVPARQLYSMAAGLTASQVALTEPLAVCVRAVRVGKVGLNDRVVIVGAGSIGLLCILAARAAGAGEVLITARHPHQQELARALGANRVFADMDGLVDGLGENCADVVLETVGGSADTLTESVRVARPGSTIVVLGIFDGHARVPGLAFINKELTLAASACYAHEASESDFGIAARLVDRYRDLLGPVVTHTFKLDQVAEAFRVADDKRQRSIKVLITP